MYSKRNCLVRCQGVTSQKKHFLTHLKIEGEDSVGITLLGLRHKIDVSDSK